MHGLYMLDESGTPQPCANVLAWAAWFETADRIVAQTEVGRYEVSTVFLGVDHGFGHTSRPVLWETMVFGRPYVHRKTGVLMRSVVPRFIGGALRYSSRADAELGHAETVALVKEAKQ